MTDLPFVESGMTFGPYPEGRCFRIEKSGTYKAVEDGVKIAEFLLPRDARDVAACVWIVEAKSSAPHPGNPIDFEEFVAEIRDKLANTLHLGLAMRLGRHPGGFDELPAPFRALDLTSIDFRLILVLEGFEKGWLPPLQDALGKELRPTVNIWALRPPAVAVLNDELAAERGLVARL